MTEDKKPKRIVRMADIVPPGFRQPEMEISIEKKPEETIEEIVEIIETTETEEEVPEIFEKPEPEKKEEPIFPEGLFIPKTPRTLRFPKIPKIKININKKILTIAGIVCVILGSLSYLYFVLLRAEVILKPKTETMQFKTDLNIDKSIAFLDLASNKIPGQIFQVEKEAQREFLATQEQDVREKASGIITIYNQYSSAPQTLVAGTRFMSEKDEKIFRTTKTIVVPGAKVEEGQIIPNTIDVEVEASEPGKDYNIEPSSFTIPGFKGTAKYTGFYGKATQAMTGGVIGRIKVVSADDIQGAKEILIVEAKEEAKKDLEKRIPSDLKVLKETTLEEVVDSSSSVEANQPAEKFTVRVKVAVKALGFSEKDAVSLINSGLKSKLEENKTILSNTAEVSYSITNINLEKGIAKLSCDVKENVAWSINVEEFRRALAGKNEAGVRQIISSHSEIETAKIIFWPFWVKTIPTNESKIKITIGEGVD